MKNEPETLESALKELMRHVREINRIEKHIDDTWGVRMIAGYIPGMANDATGEIFVRRGIEEIEKALGKDAKISPYSTTTIELRHYGITFRQYADDKTKTFVKAGKEPPKVKIVEDSEG